jgi:hypothetical protein
MPDTNQSPFSELSDYWLSITRKDYPFRGFGKWILSAEEPHRLYQILREMLLAGALPAAYSMKTKAEPAQGAKAGDVYIHTAPYTDQERVLQLAEELRELDGKHQFNLTGPLLFKTDLHNTWEFTISRPGDGYHELLQEQNWLYKYQDGKLIVNAAIQALHQALEDPPLNADQEFLIIRSLLPEELFAGE